MQKSLSDIYVVPWPNKKGNKTERRHRFTSQEASDASYNRKNIQHKDRSLEAAFGVGEQIEKQKRSVTMLEWNGMKMSVGMWAKSAGMSHQMLAHRLKAGWSVEEALGLKKRQGQKLQGRARKGER